MSTPLLLQGIAALIAAVGGIGIFFMKILLDRRDEQRRRHETVVDLLRAVQADISVERERLDAAFGEHGAVERKAALTLNIAERRTKPMPRTSTGVQSLVLDSLRKEISLLPGETIGPIIRFYRLDQGIDALDAAFSKGDYDDLDPERQLLVLKSYFLSGRRALEAAEEAIAVINDALPSSLSLSRPARLPALRRGAREG